MKKLLFLDGPYGVGKSTVAHYICEISHGKYMCIDPDKIFNNNLTYYLRYGWPVPNNSLIKNYVYKEAKKESRDKNVVIPLTLNAQDYTESWIKIFRDISDVNHIILYADRKTLTNRINGDSDRDRDFALECLESNERYYQSIIEGAIKIDTSKLTPEAVAKKILELLL